MTYQSTRKKKYCMIDRAMRISKLLLLQAMLLCAAGYCAAQPKTNSLLEKILFSNEGKIVKEVLSHKDSFRVQIIYTQINRDKHNKPSFHNYYFNADSNQSIIAYTQKGIIAPA